MQNIEDIRAKRALVEAAELFKSMPDELLEHVLDTQSFRTLERGAALLHLGQWNDHMFVVLAGELRVYIGNQKDAPCFVVHAGDAVGELSVLDRRPVSANVIAGTDVLLLAIDEPTFWRLVRGSHEFSVRLLCKLAERMQTSAAAIRANLERAATFEAAALSDALTSVLSRRWLEESLPRLCARHVHEREPLALAMLDIDHFKGINDRHGHPTGDDVLKEVANILRARLRPTDFVARFGGEEFAVILPGTTAAGAEVALGRICEAIRGTAMKAREGGPLPRVTVSVGIAQLPEAGGHVALIEAADAALYRAKQGGRDRVVSAHSGREPI